MDLTVYAQQLRAAANNYQTATLAPSDARILADQLDALARVAELEARVRELETRVPADFLTALDVVPAAHAAAHDKVCGSWPLGWSEGESVSCVLPAGHADEWCRSSLGGEWRRSPERMPSAGVTAEGESA